MKRMIITIIALLISIFVLAQGRVTTRKYRLADFPDRVTLVVLSGNEMLQGALRQEVVDKWTASPFEFCTPEEFEKRMTDERYYFLSLTENRFKGEETPGLLFLSLLKGGKEAAEEGLGGLFEVISLPVQAVEGGTGRELIYMGALVKAVQDFTLAAMESEKVAYQGADWFNARYHRMGKLMQLFIAEEDLAPQVQEADLQRRTGDGTSVVKAADADAEYLSGSANTLVTCTVAPLTPSSGSWSYLMLFEAEGEELFYVTKHKITDSKGAGISPEEFKQITRKR